MQNLKYLERINSTKTTIQLKLTEIALRHSDPIKILIAATIFEFFNDGKAIIKEDISIENGIASIVKSKYPLTGFGATA